MSTLAATAADTTDFRGLLEERLKEKKSRLGEVEEGIKKFVPDVAAGNDNNASSNNGWERRFWDYMYILKSVIEWLWSGWN